MSEDDFLILDDDPELPAVVENQQSGSAKGASFSVDLSGIGSELSKIGSGISKIGSGLSTTFKRGAKQMFPDKSAASNLDEVILAEEVETLGSSAESLDVTLGADGIMEFEWNITGMDCPDCAMKATKAVSRLPGIEDVNVSVAEGNVRTKIDIATGRASRVNSVLESLGNSPDLPWLTIQGVTPGGVSNRLGIEKKALRTALLDIPGILNVRFDDGRVEVQRVEIASIKSSELAEQRLTQILGVIPNYSVSTNSRLRNDQVQLLSAVFTIPILAGVLAIEAMDAIPDITAMMLTLIGVSFAGFPMFSAAISSIQNRVLGFQVLTSLAVVGAMIMQEWPEAIIVTGLVAFAAHLEDRALVRAREAMQGGLDRLPRRARLVNKEGGAENEDSLKDDNCEDGCCDTDSAGSKDHAHCEDDHDHDHDHSHDSGEGELTPVEAVNPGDIVEIRSGEIVPVDGLIIDGAGAIDRAPLTGEPIPIPLKIGDRVEAGLVLVRGPIVVMTEASGEDTRLASLIDLVRQYREQPTRTQTTIEKFTAIWVPFVLVGSLAYGFITKDFVTTMVLWVVSCPCSLLLASPVPHATALSTASASGLVARGGDVLEAAASIELALLDKTGTLTSGRPRISQIIVAEDETEKSVLRIASGIEQRSNHPYATTIIAAAEEAGVKPNKVSQITDGEAGVSGVMRGLPIMFGRADWLMAEGVKFPQNIDSALGDFRRTGYGASVLSLDGEAIAAFGFIHDDAREGVQEMVAQLQKHGVIVEILSGDEQASVEKFAKELGLDPKICRGNVDPEGKANWVSERAKARKTLMAGDGFNDAGALAAADVGVAVGSGDQVNLEAADVLIPGEDPRALAKLIELAKRTRTIVNINIAISVMITAILVITALAGINTSIAAGIAIHEASVFLIIINGMFVSSQNSNRIRVLLELAKDVAGDIKEAFSVLFKGRTATA